MDFALTPRQQQLVNTAEELARGFAQRAARYDEELAFPAENFAELRAHGFLTQTIPEQYGGLGLGIDNGDPLTQWLITKAIAKGDSSTGQCQQVHNNTVSLIALLGTEEQKRRYLPAVVQDGALCTAYGSEPPMVTLGQRATTTTTVARRVSGGYVINGQKYYGTSAGAVRYALLAVMLEGARDAMDGIILPVIEADTPGVTVEPQWWSHATGMRATVSHLVKFHDVFVREDELLGNPGDYLRFGIQAKLLPQFASNFVGCAEAAYEFALVYLRSKGKLADPYVQHHVAEMRMAIQTMTLWLYHTAWLWQQQQTAQAQLAAHMYRVVAEEQALNVVQLAIKACGASATMNHYPLERIHRDLTFYVRHENADNLKATVGKAELGTEYDPTLRDFLSYAIGAPQQP